MGHLRRREIAIERVGGLGVGHDEAQTPIGRQSPAWLSLAVGRCEPQSGSWKGVLGHGGRILVEAGGE